MNAAEYLVSLPFPADRFQHEAVAAIDRGESVVVAAPTGSGKTVVAEAAIVSAIGAGRRAFYTTPIKALSNQKFGDLSEQHGADNVGLLTGDNSINGRAPIVVMTTEVLRNMMYSDGPDLVDLGVVILDEVHYLQDPARGAVWEEIIIHLDRTVPLVCLSATVPNSAEFSEWVGGRRGPTSLVIETVRPVPLDSAYLLKDRWESGRLRLMDVLEGGAPNPTLLRMLRRHPGRKRYGTPRRFETCEMLAGRRMLPAIYFIFSRAGCSAAASQVVDFGLRLTTAEEAARIREIANRQTAHLDPVDLAVLGYGRWLADLEAGVAPHHAGLVPAFKETAETLFVQGLVKLVFATETLALGINMPARSVVIENLSKFTGETHELLRAGDYTQLTGRAGRRGIDRQGTAVVLHSGFVPFEEVAGIAAPGSHPLRSSFRPNYNMAVNLIAAYPREEAERLLNASFAQFRDTRRRETLEDQVAGDQEQLDRFRGQATCERGDIWTLLDGEAEGRHAAMERLAAACAAGDVLEWHERGSNRRFVVAARGTGKRPRLLLISHDARLVRIGPDRLPDSAAIIGRIPLAAPFRPRDAGYRRHLAKHLGDWEPEGPPQRPQLPETEDDGPASCPDLDDHLTAARAALRLERRLQRNRRRLAAVSGGLVPRFRAILGLLGRWGYVDGWKLTPEGTRLRSIHNEMGLLVAEAIGSGAFNGLDPAETAALASAFTYEPRSSTGDCEWPTRRSAEHADRIWESWERLSAAEADAHLPPTRAPEAGFAEIAYRWATGESLDDLFEEDGVGVGDFVRNCRQLIDLLRQLRDVAPGLVPSADEAIAAVDRGVVAAVVIR